MLVELVARRSARGPTTQGDSVVEITRQFAAEPIAIDLGVVDVSPGTLFLLGGLFVFALGLATRRIEGA